MRYFLDTEFVEEGSTIDLISIGIVCEDGRELYCEVGGFDWSMANQWVLDNVRPHLWSNLPTKPGFHTWHRDGVVGGLLRPEAISHEIYRFCDIKQHGVPEFWGYYSAYDWVLFCQLFGPMIDLPQGWPMLCYDLRQYLDHTGHKDVKQPDDQPHNSLQDARWVMNTYRTHS